MRIVHINPDRYTAQVSMHWTYSEHQPSWGPTEYGELLEDLENDPGVPFDPGTFVELARQAGAKDLAAAFARCTWVWTLHGPGLNFVPYGGAEDAEPVCEQVLMAHPEAGALLVQLQQDPTVPEGIRIRSIDNLELSVGRVIAGTCRCHKG
jgi:hypothetical protein